VATPAAVWTRVTNAAGDVETVLNWPVDDAAALIGVETAWLAGMLLALKLLVGGLYTEFTAEHRRR